MSRRPAAAAAVALAALLSLLIVPSSIVAASSAAESAGDPCATTLTPTQGRPWRPAGCTDPGYTNVRVPKGPVVNHTETRVLRTLPRMLLNIDAYSEPIHYMASGTTMRRTHCVKWGCYGGNAAPVKGNEVVSSGNDGQLTIIDVARGRSYEMYEVLRDADGTVKINSDGTVTMGSMSVVDLNGRGNTTPDGGGLNITGAGVSRIFGLIRANEVRAAAHSPRTAIQHALQVSLPGSMNCRGRFRAPATKTDGGASTSECVEEGARIHLARGFDCSTVGTNMGRAVCYALQRHGAYVMDNNGSQVIAVYAQHRHSWSTGSQDYAAAGIRGDYQDLGVPTARLRSLARWNGR